MISEIN